MKFRKLIFLLIVIHQLTDVNCSAQDLKYYRYDTDFPSKEFHKGRREALRSKMPDNSVAIFYANPELKRSGDNNYQYHQEPNFFYLTGFIEPNSLLLIFKSAATIGGKTGNEFLFVQDRDPEKELWTGRRAGVPGAKELTGIENVFLKKNYGIDSAAIINDSSLTKLTVDVKEKKLKRLMAELRQVKLPEELTLMRKAIQMSCEGHNEIMRTIKPEMYEYDVQAIGEYLFKHNGSEYVAYPSICGGGENSCILHYNTNRRILKSGEVQLNDMAAEYHGYAADVTRTIPVNGKFSPEQKIIYELVLKAQQAGFEACKPGNDFLAPHNAATKIIIKGLLDLGILKDSADYKTYFMHGTSHYLGLDVHDAGIRDKLVPDNVLTVEPGIYIAENSNCDKKWWNIGVRIEDDILITESGYENLSASSPRSVIEIEAMMKQKPIYIKEQK